MLWFILLNLTFGAFAGTIKPGRIAIENSIANQGKYSDYTFYLIPETTVPKGGRVIITFPIQFQAGLGIQRVTNKTCNYPCQIDLNHVSFYFEDEILANVEKMLKIYGVLNPKSSGGTGNFIVKTMRHEYLFDENYIFSVLGVADNIILLSSTIVTPDKISGTFKAGKVSKYNFAFKTNTNLPLGTKIQLGIPMESGYDVSDFPSCQLYPINNVIIKGQIRCARIGNQIVVSGFGEDISSGTEVGISVSMTNPKYSTITGKFSIAAFKERTSVIYTWRNEINNIQITPGDISDVVLKPLTTGIRQALGKIMDYRLSFLPTNPMPQGSIIRLEFPVTFQLVYGQIYDYVFVEEGLDDTSEANPLKVEFTSNWIQISDYLGTQKASTITVIFRAINPSDSGMSSPIVIRTYMDITMQQIIDENTTDATTIIENTSSLSPSQATLSNPKSQGQATDLTFTITPSVFVPGGATIKILLPIQFAVGPIKAQNCISRVLGNVASEKCIKSDNLITITNPSTVSYNVATNSQFKLTGLLFTPLYANTYLADIEVWQGFILQQSYSDYIIVQPLELVSPLVRLLGNERSVLPASPKYSILHVEFKNLIIVPQGTWQKKTTDLQGRIEIAFGALGEWSNDLGTSISNGGIIPCKEISGILPIQGSKIQCNIYHGDGTTKLPLIVVRNFKQIDVGTNIVIHVPKILNSAITGATTAMQIRLMQYNNRARTVLNDAASLTVDLQDQGTATPGSTTDPSMDVSSLALNGFFDLTFEPKIGFDLEENSYFLLKLPGYDNMFIPPEDGVLCYIDQYITPCIKYEGIDWILFKTELGQKHFYQLKPTITVKNLRWPRYADSVGKVQWVMIDGSTRQELEIKTLGYSAGNTNFPKPQFNDFLEAKIRVPVKGKSFVGLDLEFYFVPTDVIPDGGTVILKFPTEFTLEASYPEVKFKAPQFQGVSQRKPLTFTTNANILTITNIKEHAAGSPFTIIVEGIRTLEQPPDDTADGFSIESQYQGNLINQRLNFDYFKYGERYQPGVVIFSSVSAFPTNQLEIALYTFEFTLPSELGKGGEIIITFPDAYYPALPEPPIDARCQVKGGLNSFYSCTLTENSYIIIIDDVYRSGSITFTINNIRNPLQGVIKGFSIQTRIDSTFLDITDVAQQLTITPKAEPILVQNIEFDPRNEGEVATYTFTFVPSTPIGRDIFVVIEFPQEYDPRLGDKVVCALKERAFCDVRNRQIWVEGVVDYEPSGTNPIVVQITGVVNPNRNLNNLETSSFKIGTILMNTETYIDYNNNAGTLQMSQAPGWAYLYNLLPSNTYARWRSTEYTFNFTSKKGVPRAGAQGYIVVDFPNQFDIPNGDVPCYPLEGPKGEMFAQNMECSFYENTVRIQGNTEDKQGFVLFSIKDVANPPEELTSDNFIVKVYDGFKKEIVEKSFTNLDPWTFKYVFPGPLITINDDNPIVVERGTQTQDMWFTVEYPSPLNLTITPQIKGITIIPQKIKIAQTDLRAKFRVSVPENTPAGTYYIIWETEGDTQGYYTPLKKTEVRVTAVRNIRINVEPLKEIPINGTSLDSFMTVDFAPDLGVEILLRPLSKTINLSTKSLFLASGWNNVSFRVGCNKTEYDRQKQLELDRTDVREIELYLEGINKDVYVLSRSILKVVFIQQDTEPPFITELTPIKITQTTAEILFGSGEICVVYYMISLIGTERPPAQELINAGPYQLPTTLTRYGKVSIGRENQARLLIDKLKAETPYVIYAVAEDRGGLFSDIKNVEFWTQKRHNAAFFQVVFKQSYLNEAERANVREKIATVLSLPKANVLEKEYDIANQLQQRVLQTEDITYSIDLYLVSLPHIENFPSPVELVDVLNQRKQILSGLVANLDLHQTIKGKEFIRYVPHFVFPPSVVEITYDSCTITAQIDEVGFFFVTAQPAATNAEKPRAIQVYWGFDNQNNVRASEFVKVSEKFFDYNVTIYNLQTDTEYNIYLVTGSAHPGYPDLPDDKGVHQVACRTKAYQPRVYLNIEWSALVSVLVLLMTLML